MNSKKNKSEQVAVVHSAFEGTYRFEDKDAFTALDFALTFATSLRSVIGKRDGFTTSDISRDPASIFP